MHPHNLGKSFVGAGKALGCGTSLAPFLSLLLHPPLFVQMQTDRLSQRTLSKSPSTPFTSFSVNGRLRMTRRSHLLAIHGFFLHVQAKHSPAFEKSYPSSSVNALNRRHQVDTLPGILSTVQPEAAQERDIRAGHTFVEMIHHLRHHAPEQAHTILMPT